MLLATSGASFTAELPNEQAMVRFAIDVACALEPGDLVTLSGDLGAGKTTFARALIRYLADDDTIEVPSPTFTLLQTYELPRFNVVHADLYRLSSAAELSELGFDDLPEDSVVLMEWGDRAAGFLPASRLDITFTLEPALGAEVRDARYTGYGTFAARAERIAQVRNFLEETGYAEASRRRMQGDASTRIFERLTLDGHTMVLMNAPPHPDGPPIRDGKPYSAIAHLAENTVPYVALAEALRERSLFNACDPASRHYAGIGHHGGPRRRARRRGRSAGPDRGALPGRPRCLDIPASAPTPRHAAGFRLSAAAIRYGCVPDRGRAVARLVSGAREIADHGGQARDFPLAVARCAGARDRSAGNLGAARFPFAQSAVASRAP